MYLMSKNIVVAEIDFNKLIFDIKRPDLMPFALRGNNVSIFSVYDWLSGRVLSLSRSNAKKILDSLNLDQTDRMKICISCKALSLTDCYWLKGDKDSATWDKVNLYSNSLSEAVARVALIGEYVSIQGKIRTPELTNDGAYAKCWRRGKDGIYLYKAGSSNGNGKEYLVDILCSDLLDRLDVRHVKYNKAVSNFRPVSRCKNMTDLNRSICPMNYFEGYCNRNNINLQNYLLNCKDYLDMLIVDYLIYNTDRHKENWGVYFNADTGKFECLHPLFDHNLALDLNGDFMSKVIPNKTLEECAMFAKKRDNLDIKDYYKYLKSSSVKNRFYEIFNRLDEYSACVDRAKKFMKW